VRPLGLGELLDRAFTFWRAHWKPLFQLILGFQLVTFVLIASAEGARRKLFPLASDPVALRSPNGAALPDLLGYMGLLFAASLGALFLSQVSGVAATWFTWSRLTGRGNPTPADAFRHAAARLGTTTGAFIASLVWSALVMLLMVLPGFGLSFAAGWFEVQGSRGLSAFFLVTGVLALLLGMVVLILWFVIRFILMSQIIAVETPTAWQAFKRADALSSGRVEPGFMGLVKVRLTVLVTVIGGVLLIVSAVTTVPMGIVSVIYGANPFKPGETLQDVAPLPILAAVQLIQTLLGALVAPLFAVFQTWFYADMRARREGLDLELALDGQAPT
jgi:hypothetical protein